MQRVRLLFLLGLVLAVGATCVAKDQAAAPTKDQAQKQDRDSKHQKAKDKSDEGGRKHWWSPPHRHKKHDAGAPQAGTDSNSKTASVKPVKMDQTAAQSKPDKKPAAATKSGRKTVASGSKPAAPGNKAVASTAHSRKTVRHNCSPEEAKKGGCTAQKTHSLKPATNPS